jgi:glycosyltransferase involved in cell wall biosynthesis
MLDSKSQKNLASEIQNAILTVLIPTFNGENTIQRTLVSVFDQIESLQLEDKVKVIVADNCSTDSTKAIVRELVGKRDWVQLIESKENLGLDKNLQFAMGIVVTPYVKLLSDDDYILPGYIPYLLSIINKHKNIDLIVSSMQAIGISDKVESHSVPSLLHFCNNPAFFKSSNSAFGQLSTLCIKTESWFESNDSQILLDYRHHNMEFVGRIYYLAINGCCIYDDSKLMENDLGPKRWNQTYLDVFKVNCSHASFIFQIDTLDDGNFSDLKVWKKWINNSIKSLIHQLIIDIFELRRINISLYDEAVLAYVPLAVKEKPYFLHFVRLIDIMPVWLCTLIVRMDFFYKNLKAKAKYWLRYFKR